MHGPWVCPLCSFKMQVVFDRPRFCEPTTVPSLKCETCETVFLIKFALAKPDGKALKKYERDKFVFQSKILKVTALGAELLREKLEEEKSV